MVLCMDIPLSGHSSISCNYAKVALSHHPAHTRKAKVDPNLDPNLESHALQGTTYCNLSGWGSAKTQPCYSIPCSKLPRTFANSFGIGGINEIRPLFICRFSLRSAPIHYDLYTSPLAATLFPAMVLFRAFTPLLALVAGTNAFYEKSSGVLMLDAKSFRKEIANSQHVSVGCLFLAWLWWN